jgi:glucuronokinase
MFPVGGDSGAVHNTVRARWEAQDSELVRGMQALGMYTDAALQCLRDGDVAGLAALAAKNFAMRLALYGAEVVGAKNLQMVELATQLGFGAKFTGSGGALLCIRKDGLGL